MARPVTSKATGKATTPANRGGDWIHLPTRLAIYYRDCFSCVYCGAFCPCPVGYGLSIDHVVPPSEGGSNSPTNLVTCCDHCNKSKADLSMRDWFKRLRSKGVDTTGLSAKIKRRRLRDIKPFRVMGRELAVQRRPSTAKTNRDKGDSDA